MFSFLTASTWTRFEFGCTMRKMILTGALVLFGAGTTAQVVTALAVCILWLTLIANLKPFGDDVDDRLAQVEAIQILFTLLIGLVLQLQAATQDGSREEEDALGVMLIILNLAVIALAFVQQPIFLKIASRVSEVIARIKERASSHTKNKKGTSDAADDAVLVGIEMQSNPSYAAGPTGLRQPEFRAAKGTPASKIEMRANPLVPAARPGSLAVTAATPLQPTVGTTDEDRTEDAQARGVENARLRAEIAQLRAEMEQMKEAQPGAVVELGVAAEAAVVQHPAVETPGEQCPRGWSSVSHETGAYFNNDYTGATTYAKPMFPAPPEGWSVHAHGDGGDHYFQHDAGGCETQWHHPFDEDPNDAATMTGSTAEAAAAASDEWYYNDYVNVDELHGPFALAQLKAWVDEGEMPASRLVRNGREGEEVELGSCG